MARAVLDASAVLAVYLLESGAEAAADVMSDSLVSSVNITEILSKLLDRGASANVLMLAQATLRDLQAPFDFDLARRAAELRTITRPLGLSLGDRACLALAQREGLPVLTADRTWADLRIGVDVRVLR